MDSQNIPPPNSSPNSSPNQSPNQSPKLSPRTLSAKLSEILTMTNAFQDGNTRKSASSETPAESSRLSSPPASSVPVDDTWTTRTYFSCSHDDSCILLGCVMIEEFIQSLEQESRDETEVGLMEGAVFIFENARRYAELTLLIYLSEERNDIRLEEVMKEMREVEEKQEDALRKFQEIGARKNSGGVFYRRNSI
ncbi:036c3775-9f0c-4792-9af3-2160c2829c55-CDS [Sclerotinia trifoliorum]|uniref:036c3775-9f0c-4792-9af3-2160c2829c55-CDS n=1 Tax=Sclerotinia trifoliorum TaxID=28548 RepID=A0A8H2VMU0_9HELO|nr:036c3775-9f0c-4792-9af3-2160c2829c55-CDS [Sclerotinia trifoliorum]